MTSLSIGSGFPPGGGGLFVPGPPFRSQSKNEPLYSPTFWYLNQVSTNPIPYSSFPRTREERVYKTHPACFANCAAAALLTPALQKNTTSFSTGGFWNPKRSSNSSSGSRRASGWLVTGILMAVGMEFVKYSEGSRTSIRTVVSEGLEMRRWTYGERRCQHWQGDTERLKGEDCKA